jgi:hypothetical protein
MTKRIHQAGFDVFCLSGLKKSLYLFQDFRIEAGFQTQLLERVVIVSVEGCDVRRKTRNCAVDARTAGSTALR